MKLSVWVRTGLAAIAVSTVAPAASVPFNVVDLVTSASDSDLINPWGITAGPTTPFWVSDNGMDRATLYNGAGVKQALVVTIPGGAPTGVVFNGGSSFNTDRFIFASEAGSITGWRGALGTTAEVLSPTSDDIYKGLALGTVGGRDYLYAANFHSGGIFVLPDSGAPALSGTFTDPGLPSGFAPFNIVNIGGTIYVSYAKQDAAAHDDVPGPGNGFISRFDLNGNFLGRLVSDGALDSPWGMAVAPAGFGDLGGALLVGNFGDGHINAYNATSGALIETLRGLDGNPLAIDGLWGLQFGNGAAGGTAGVLYFTAGPDEESGGILGSITATPEPGTWLLCAAALLPLLLRRYVPRRLP